MINMSREAVVVFIAAGLFLFPATAAADFIKPWDPLTTDSVDDEPSWIGSGVTVYTVNAGTYTVGFDESKPMNNYAAAGMNSVTFVYGGSNTVPGEERQGQYVHRSSAVDFDRRRESSRGFLVHNRRTGMDRSG